MSDLGGESTEPRVVVDSAGNATAIWRHLDNLASTTVIKASFRPAGGTWGRPPPCPQRLRTVQAIRRRDVSSYRRGYLVMTTPPEPRDASASAPRAARRAPSPRSLSHQARTTSPSFLNQRVGRPRCGLA